MQPPPPPGPPPRPIRLCSQAQNAKDTDLNLLIDKKFFGNFSVSLVQTRMMKGDTKRKSQLQIVIFHCFDQRVDLNKQINKQNQRIPQWTFKPHHVIRFIISSYVIG